MKKTQKQTIKELERLIQIKEEVIKELERQNQILKNQPPIHVPVNPQPFVPVSPQPISPWQPWTPNQPWWGPVIVTSTSSDSITFDPNTPYTVTNNITLS